MRKFNLLYTKSLINLYSKNAPRLLANYSWKLALSSCMKVLFAVLIGVQPILAGSCAIAAGKSKNTDDEELKKIEESVDILVKKIYASSLFSPEDAEKLVEIMIKLDSVMNATAKNPIYARLFFDLGHICQAREYTDESIQYFKFVNENFPETSYAKRAVSEMKKLGVKFDDEE